MHKGTSHNIKYSKFKILVVRYLASVLEKRNKDSRRTYQTSQKYSDGLFNAWFSHFGLLQKWEVMIPKEGDQNYVTFMDTARQWKPWEDG